MSRQTIILNESLRAWAGRDRPLKSLPKAALMKYPLANPTPEAEFDFGVEMLARHAGHRALEHDIARAEADLVGVGHRLNGAEVQLSQAREKLTQVKALTGSEPQQETELVASSERTLKAIQSTAARQQEHVAKLKARLTDATKSDAIVSAEEIHGHYAARYAPAWAEIVRKWQEGALFHAQTAGWLTFLKMKRSNRDADFKAFWDAEGIAKLVGAEKTPNLLAMSALYSIRIEPSLASRRIYLTDNSPDGELSTAGLKPALRRDYWRQRRAYARASIKFGWMDDDFGNTFDPNQVGSAHAFNPYEEAAEERYAD